MLGPDEGADVPEKDEKNEVPDPLPTAETSQTGGKEVLENRGTGEAPAAKEAQEKAEAEAADDE